MLEVKCEEHLAAARAFADSVGAREQLEDKLKYLETYRDSTCRVVLHRDPWSDHSFEFTLFGPENPTTKERSVWFNGGLVLHAPHSTGVGAPEFAVTLNPQPGYHWQVHT